MTIRARALLLVAALGLAACDLASPGKPAESSPQGPAPVLATEDAKDIHSFARPAEARVTHVALDLAVDFERKRLFGGAALDIERKPDATEIVLDSKGLEIDSIKDGAGQPLEWKLGPADEILGAPLVVA